MRYLVGAVLLIPAIATASWDVEVASTRVEQPPVACPVEAPDCALGTYLASGSGVPPVPAGDGGVSIVGTVAVPADESAPYGLATDAVAFRLAADGTLLWEARTHERLYDAFRFARDVGDGEMLAVGVTSPGYTPGESVIAVRYDASGEVLWRIVSDFDISPAGVSDVEVLNASGDAILLMDSGHVIPGVGIHLVRIDADGSVAWTSPGTPMAGHWSVQSVLLPDGTVVVQVDVVPTGVNRYLGFRASDGALLWDVAPRKDDVDIESTILGATADGGLLLRTIRRVDTDVLEYGLAHLDSSGAIEVDELMALPPGTSIRTSRLLASGVVLHVRNDAVDGARFWTSYVEPGESPGPWTPIDLPPTTTGLTLYEHRGRPLLMVPQGTAEPPRYDAMLLRDDGTLQRIATLPLQLPWQSHRVVVRDSDLTLVQSASDAADPRRHIRATRVDLPILIDGFE